MSNAKRTHSATSPKSRNYWLYGIHAVRAALANPERNILRVLATPASLEKIAAEAAARPIRVEQKAPQDIAKLLAPDAVHQGVAAEVRPLAERSLDDVDVTQLNAPLLMLDQVTDPHNVGAILRSAAAFGVAAVIVTRDHAPPESAVLAKASSGGIELVPLLVVTNLTQAMETLKKHGFWCVGMDGEAPQAMGQATLSRKTALVMGAEGKGLRRLTAERCDMLVRLPMSPRMESLNVSNAAAIALYILSQIS